MDLENELNDPSYSYAVEYICMCKCECTEDVGPNRRYCAACLQTCIN